MARQGRATCLGSHRQEGGSAPACVCHAALIGPCWVLLSPMARQGRATCLGLHRQEGGGAPFCRGHGWL